MDIDRLVREVRVHAVWDGVLEHPVQVTVKVKVESLPSASLLLIDCTNTYTQSAEITNTHTLPTSDQKPNSNHRQEAHDELIGTTSTASVRDRAMGRLQPQHENSVFFQKSSENSEYIHTSSRQHDNVKPTRFLSGTSLSTRSASERGLDHIHYVPDDHSKTCNRSLSGETVEIHLTSRSSSMKTEDCELSHRNSKPGSKPEPNESTLNYQHEDMGDIKVLTRTKSFDCSTLGSQSPTRKIWKRPSAILLRKKSWEALEQYSKSEPSASQMEKNRKRHEKIPWQPPSQADFSPKKRCNNPLKTPTRGSPGSTASSPTSKLPRASVRGAFLEKNKTNYTDPIRHCSKARENARTPTKLPRLSKQNLLSANRSYRLSTPRGCYSSPSRSKRTLPPRQSGQQTFSQAGSLKKAHRDQISDRQTSTNSASLLELNDDKKACLRRVSGDSTLGDGLRFPSQTCTETSSPAISPKVWLRYRGSSSKYFMQTPMKDSGIEVIPTLKRESEQLYVCFSESAHRATYEVEIRARIALTKADSLGWRRFCLRGLPKVSAESQIRHFTFLVEEKKYSRANSDLQYTSEGSQVYHDKASSTTSNCWEADGLTLLIRPKESVHCIENFSINVIVHAFPPILEDTHVKIAYRAALTFGPLNQDLFTHQVSLSIVARHSTLEKRMYRLSQGDYALTSKHISYLNSCKPGNESLLTIVRSLEDAQKPLDIYFTIAYPRSNILKLLLPTFRPQSGKVLSASLYLAYPIPPLFLEPIPIESLHGWRVVDHPPETCPPNLFHQVGLLSRSPESMEANAVVKIKELYPVAFRALENHEHCCILEQPSDVISDFKVRIGEAFGGGIECQLMADIQVGFNWTLLTIDPGSWGIKFALTNRRLATEDAGEWRIDRNGDYALYKMAGMITGQIIRIEMHFESSETNRLTLPRVVDKVILGGSLKCDMVTCKVCFCNGPDCVVERTMGGTDFRTMRIPKLHPDHWFNISCFRPSEHFEIATDGEKTAREKLPIRKKKPSHGLVGRSETSSSSTVSANGLDGDYLLVPLQSPPLSDRANNSGGDQKDMAIQRRRVRSSAFHSRKDEDDDMYTGSETSSAFDEIPRDYAGHSYLSENYDWPYKAVRVIVPPTLIFLALFVVLLRAYAVCVRFIKSFNMIHKTQRNVGQESYSRPSLASRSDDTTFGSKLLELPEVAADRMSKLVQNWIVEAVEGIRGRDCQVGLNTAMLVPSKWEAPPTTDATKAKRTTVRQINDGMARHKRIRERYGREDADMIDWMDTVLGRGKARRN